MTTYVISHYDNICDKSLLHWQSIPRATCRQYNKRHTSLLHFTANLACNFYINLLLKISKIRKENINKKPQYSFNHYYTTVIMVF